MVTARRQLSSAQRGLGSAHRRIRLQVLQRDGYRCHWCGARADTADHVVPRALGGRSSVANMVAACTPCNSERGARLAALIRARNRLRPSRVWFDGTEGPKSGGRVAPGSTQTGRAG
jgi:5-methylcytosine-specific restriction endonuclease McrA